MKCFAVPTWDPLPDGAVIALCFPSFAPRQLRNNPCSVNIPPSSPILRIWKLQNLEIQYEVNYKVVQIWPGLRAACLHTNQSRSYLNHLVLANVTVHIYPTFYSLFWCTPHNAPRLTFPRQNVSWFLISRLHRQYKSLNTEFFGWCLCRNNLYERSENSVHFHQTMCRRL